MLVENISCADWRIDSEGVITQESVWRLALDEPSINVEELVEKAQEWAGKIGDPFRIPAGEGDSYRYSLELEVCEIRMTPVSASICEVTLVGGIPGQGGSGGGSSAKRNSTEDRYDADGVHIRVMRSFVPAGSEPAAFPQSGDVLDWGGGAFHCESSVLTRTAGEKSLCVITGREITMQMLGGASSARDADGVEEKQSVWFVAATELPTFLASHPVCGPEEWAGEHCYLVSVESQAHGRIGFKVTLRARKVETRRVSEVRGERFAGFSRGGAPMREIVWKARFLVHADDISRFSNLVGGIPYEWGEEGCIVTEVAPVRLSPVEYEIMVEAQHQSNPGLQRQYNTDDVSDLAGRKDYSVDMAELHISAEMAGYQKQVNGAYLVIPRWEASSSCPFSVSGPLSGSLIESTVRCLVIVETAYFSGGVEKQLSGLASWASSRVTENPVAGMSGSYLKIAQTCREVRDDSGKVFTRVVRSFQRSPEGLSWNSGYWGSH